jgi:hypothetical protein
MRKRSIMAGVGALAVSALAFIPLAGAGAAPGASDFCTANGDFGGNHGQCVSIVQSFVNNGNNDPAGYCRLLDLTGSLPPGVSRGQCVSFFRHL